MNSEIFIPFKAKVPKEGVSHVIHCIKRERETETETERQTDSKIQT